MVLRESGLAYCRRELGMNPGRGKLLLTGLLGAFVLLSPFVVGSRPGLSIEAGILVSVLTIPVMLLAAMIDAPRAFSGGTDRAYTEDLLLTPLGFERIAQGKVFARGLPVFVYASSIAVLGMVCLLVTLGSILLGAGKPDSLGFTAAFGCILGATLIVRCYLGGLRAGLRENHVVLRAIGAYLLAIAGALLLLTFAIMYSSSDELPRRGLQVLGITVSIDRNPSGTRTVFRGLVLLSAVPLLYLWCRADYEKLVASLDRELRRRLRLLEE